MFRFRTPQQRKGYSNIGCFPEYNITTSIQHPDLRTRFAVDHITIYRIHLIIIALIVFGEGEIVLGSVDFAVDAMPDGVDFYLH